MKVRVKFLLTIAGLATLLTLSKVAWTAASNNRVEKVLNVSTGLIGLPPGHTAKLTLANFGKRSAPPAAARLVLLDESDRILSLQDVVVEPGKPASVEVNRDQLSRNEDRVPVRASVLNPIGPRGRNDLILTFEIFDATDSLSPSFAAVVCPPKIPGRGGDVIDCADPCGCVIGIPQDFAGGSGTP